MPLIPGAKLGPYEIIGPLGAGGMGEVYSARDTRLDRTVALKVLPSALAADPEMQARLQREARAISSLNHPNICALYDIGQQDGVHFLVMELIKGESLGERLRKGPLPLAELLTYSLQIADALEKAHRQGIVHRDLKPGNIMITKSGTKLLDFGLAKLRALSEKEGMLSELSTRYDPITQKGMVLGTIQYMSPEQLEGKEADARSDIFAFGAVLYEMASGKRAFNGNSQASLIASILKEHPPPISRQQPLTPPALEYVVRSCLVKDPEERLQNAMDLKHALHWVNDLVSRTPGDRQATTTSRKRGALTSLLVACAFLLGGLAVALFPFFKTNKNVGQVASRMVVPLPAGQEAINLTVSPDGHSLIVAATGSAGSRLFLRRAIQFETVAIAGTDRATSPFFSPDGKWIGFFSGDKLKKVPLSGGTPATICEALNDVGGSWNTEGTIVFSKIYGSGLARVSADGGTPQPLTFLDTGKGERAHSWPHFLPDGKSFLFTIQAGPGMETRSVALYSLETKQTRILVERASHARFANGYLLFSRDGSLLAAPFDPKRLEITGPIFMVIDGVLDSLSDADSRFDVSHSGTLAFIPGPAVGTENRELVWFDRVKGESSITDRKLPYYNPRISPDGRKLAVNVYQEGRFVIAILDLERGTWSRLPTEGSSAYATWTPDGTKLVYSSNASGPNAILWHAVDGTGAPQTLVSSAQTTLLPGPWTPDGARMVLTEVEQKTSGNVGLFLMSAIGKFQSYRKSLYDEFAPSLSPDGKWIAYSSNESGMYEIYMEAFPGPGPRWQISSGDGQNFEPVFSRNGRELFFTHNDQSYHSVSLKDGADPAPSKPMLVVKKDVFADLDGLPSYDVAPDGRLVIIKREPIQSPTEVRVLLNWLAATRK